jgi:hypothetical protein
MRRTMLNLIKRMWLMIFYVFFTFQIIQIHKLWIEIAQAISFLYITRAGFYYL